MTLLRLALPLLSVALGTSVASAQFPIQVMERVNVDSAGAQANAQDFEYVSISGDGRYISFTSSASNLVAGDTNGVADVFWHDRVTGATERVSVGTGGFQSDGTSDQTAISEDGQCIVFRSDADNLSTTDLDSVENIFIHDRSTGVTELVNVQASGVAWQFTCSSPTVSKDGKHVAFESEDAIEHSIHLRDRTVGTTTLISTPPIGALPGLRNYDSPSISGDGQVVAFRAVGPSLLPGAPEPEDIFVRNISTGVSELVSVAGGGFAALTVGAPAISPDGGFVAFASPNPTLVPADNNFGFDVFLRDLTIGYTQRVSRRWGGPEADGSTTLPASIAISDGGRYVTFSSDSPNLIPGDVNGIEDVFVYDQLRHITKIVNRNASAQQASAPSQFVDMSSDGRFVVFASAGPNLVAGDTNGAVDVFVRDLATGGPEVFVPGPQTYVFVSGATPGGVVILGASLVGQGPLPSPWGLLSLGSLDVIVPIIADAQGAASLPIYISTMPFGTPLWIQGIDVGTNYPTSAWGGWIQ